MNGNCARIGLLFLALDIGLATSACQRSPTVVRSHYGLVSYQLPGTWRSEPEKDAISLVPPEGQSFGLVIGQTERFPPNENEETMMRVRLERRFRKVLALKELPPNSKLQIREGHLRNGGSAIYFPVSNSMERGIRGYLYSRSHFASIIGTAPGADSKDAERCRVELDTLIDGLGID